MILNRLLRSVHTRRQVAATRRGDRSLHVYWSGDQLQQQGEATRRSDKSLRVYWRIFVKIFVSATEFCRCNKSQKNQIRLNLCDLLWRQILLQRQRFSQKFSSTHEAICRCNMSPRHVAATCRLVCTDL